MAIDQRGILARSIAQFCKDTSLGRSFVYEEIKSGRLRSVKKGRRRLIPDEDGREWLRTFRPRAKEKTGANKPPARRDGVEDYDSDSQTNPGQRPRCTSASSSAATASKTTRTQSPAGGDNND
jgi:excisionase family DNA binding protein